MSTKNDVLVVGAGLAGLTAVWQLATQQKKARLVSKGWGATHWHSGCIDVLGYYPIDESQPVESPGVTLAKLIADQPEHPYALVGVAGVEEALTMFQTLCAEAGYPLHGSLDKNWLLPSAVGTFRPTCLAPETMIAGDLRRDDPMLIVGIKQLVDFYPNIVAENLVKQGVEAAHLMLDMPKLAQRNFNTPVSIGSMMEQPSFRSDLVRFIKPKLGKAKRVGLPAVLGRYPSLTIKNDLEKQLGVPVFEIPGLPPSLPGLRLYLRILAQRSSRWNTSSCEQNFTRQGAEAFNQPLSFDTSQVTNMKNLFRVRSSCARARSPSTPSLSCTHVAQLARRLLHHLGRPRQYSTRC